MSLVKKEMAQSLPFLPGNTFADPTVSCLRNHINSRARFSSQVKSCAHHSGNHVAHLHTCNFLRFLKFNGTYACLRLDGNLKIRWGKGLEEEGDCRNSTIIKLYYQLNRAVQGAGTQGKHLLTCLGSVTDYDNCMYSCHFFHRKHVSMSPKPSPTRMAMPFPAGHSWEWGVTPCLWTSSLRLS